MKTLIINTGPPGDVLRTTVILKELEGDIFWLTKKSCEDVLNSKLIKKIFYIEKDLEILNKIEFDLVLSLNEEIEILQKIKKIKYKKIIGVFLNNENRVDYTYESKYWFDMALCSKLGKVKADQLKAENRKSYQQILLEIMGKIWKGQEYNIDILPNYYSKKIGLININTGIWENKSWTGYDEIFIRIKKELNIEPFFIPLRPRIIDHINDINECQIIICGDTLGMHIALALEKKVITLFNCTSPHEIFDYGRMIKIVSPTYEKYFYQKKYSKEAVDSIKVDIVFDSLKKLLTRNDL